MKPIVTLTLNPCIDGSAEAEVVRPTRKIRTAGDRYDPGGGGINVARVIAELGGAAAPVYLSGGATGPVLDAMLRSAGFDARPVPIRDHTRISHAVLERSSGLEYRFVPEGPEISAEEWAACRRALEALDFDWLVVSGSLPRGFSPARFAEIGPLAAERGARLVIDTSGPALEAAIGAGGAYLAKPSVGEFRALIGRPLESIEEIEAAALGIVSAGGAEMLAVSLGHEGALLATAEGASRLRPPLLPVRSATGAGDSFLGAMVFALAAGRPAADAFRLGVAAGSATVLTPGTGLCRRADVERIYVELGAAG